MLDLTRKMGEADTPDGPPVDRIDAEQLALGDAPGTETTAQKRVLRWVGLEGVTVLGVRELPSHAAIRCRVAIGALHRLPVGETGHHVVALGAETGMECVVLAAGLLGSDLRRRRHGKQGHGGWGCWQPAPRPLARDPHGPHLDGPLRLLRGFERIENGWWDDRDIQRDYFIAADSQGARLWVYREDGPAGEPDPERWFLHGLFS